VAGALACFLQVNSPEDISIPMVITDLEKMCILDLRAADTAGGEYDYSEEGLTSGSPLISLNEANLHLTAFLYLLETITVTELPID
jgi:hypothetical protein